MKQCRISRSLHFRVMVVIVLTYIIAGIVSSALWLFLPSMHGRVFAPFVPLILSVVISAVITGFVLKRPLKPVKELQALTQKVAEGDFSVRASEVAEGDMLELEKSFNRMVADLEGMELLRNDFIDTFSHEFKTPIVSIRGFARRLRAGGLSVEKQTEYLDYIVTESERLSQLSQSILLLSKYENQQFVGDKKEYWLDEQLRNCVLALEKQWEPKGVSFDLDLPNLRYVNNEEMMEHVWRNIIGNAVKFSRPGGVIHIGARTAGNYVTVSVRDRGEGISAEAISHIFDKFYQGDAAHAREGNGLGLSLVRRIVELSGGDITVESQEGRGTTFHVRLPLDRHAAA